MQRSTLSVKVIPKASRTEVVGWEGGWLKVRVAAIPEKNAANKELIRYLSKLLDVGKSCISVDLGTTSRQKTLSIEGLSKEELEKRLKSVLDN